MNQHQHFDEHIKDQFAGYTAKVPGGTWENIEKRRGKRKPGALWFLSGRTNLLVLFLLLAGGSGAWLYINHKNKNEQDKNDNSAANTTNKKTNYRQRTNETNLPNADTTTTIQPTQTNNEQTTSPVTNSNQQRTPLAINSKIKPGRPGDYTVSDPQRNSPNTSTAYSKNNNEIAGFAKNRKRANTEGKRNIKIGNAVPVETGAEDEGVDPVSTDATAATGSGWRRLRSEAERATAKGKAKQKPPIPLLAPNFLPGCPTIEKNASGNKKYFEIYAGPDYSFRSFSNLGDTASASYMQKRKETTSYSSAYSAGIRYTKVFNNSMSIRAGFNYSQINEKFSLVQGNVVHITYIIDNHGDTTGSFSTTGTRIKTTHNKYRSIDIPLTIGYELGNGRWHANINAGAMINLYSWQKGELLDTAFSPVSITTGKGAAPYQFKTNTGIGFLGGVSVYYRLSDNWHLLAEPWFRYNFSPMNKESSNLKQRYHTLGLRFGVRLDIP